jgi:hypothetical protein
MRAIEAVRKATNPAIALMFESILFNLADKYCGGAYGGGQWVSKLIEPGVWLAVPPIDGKFTFINPDNGFEGEVSALTAGAAITCIALNQVIWRVYNSGNELAAQAISALWETATDACYNLADADFDKTAFIRIID